jgi:ABC-type multidrug transport system fused ATPase/permease subunit
MSKSDALISSLPSGEQISQRAYPNGITQTETANPVPVVVTEPSQEAPPLGFPDLVRLVRPQRGKLIVSGILSVSSVLLSLAPFVLIYWLTLDLFAGRVDAQRIWTLAGLAAVAVVLRFVFFGAALLVSHAAAFAFLYDLRVQLARTLGDLPLGFFSQRTTGEIKKVLNEDVEQIELFVAHQLPDLVAAAALPLLTAGYLFTVDWRMTLVSLAVFPFAMLAQSWMMSGTQQRWQEYHDILEKMNATILEYTRGMAVIKAFNQTTESFARFADTVRTHRDYTARLTDLSALPYTLYSVLITSNLFVLLPVGLWLHLSGSLDIPTLVLFLFLGIGITVPCQRLLFFFGQFMRLAEGAKRVVRFLNQPPLPEPKLEARPQGHSVEFRQVDFAYGNGEAALRGVNFVAREGTVTALVGPSGAGKTTVARLIARFWDVTDGAVLIGGADVKTLSFDHLMEQVAFVFQEVFLFDDTVLNNIRMGRPDATETEILAAATAARCHEFVTALPQGYQTVIGERGARLSGGEKQRLSIARAILKNAPILVLDEATAFADPYTESQIQEGLAVLCREKTVIVIAHRLSTITHADTIVVLDEGRVVAQGRHEALLVSCETYRRLWEAHVAARSWSFIREGVRA